MDRTHRPNDEQIMRILLTVSFFLFVSCANHNVKTHGEAHKMAETDNAIGMLANDTVSFAQIGRLDKKRLLIEHDFDLNGKTCRLPKGITLCMRGGVIKNGFIYGDETRISGKGPFFDKVTICGSWNVPDISTSLFANMDYENSLKDVVALADPKVKNVIVVDEGIYYVRALKRSDACVSLCSNTDFILNGSISLMANGLKGYNIVLAKGDNIRISGKGSIIGDKHTHTGTEGEWGMGVRFHGARNSSIHGLKIQDCWGDCIYVSGNSKNIMIENCHLDHGRRQGISITKADGVTIRNCKITNVGGKNPEYAIDVEPNKGDTVDNVVIENVAIDNCEGGILAVRPVTKKNKKATRWIGNVTIKDCHVTANSKRPMSFRKCDKVLVENNMIYKTNDNPAVNAEHIECIMINNNTIRVNNNRHDRGLMNKEAITPHMNITNTKVQKVSNNIIVSK